MNDTYTRHGVKYARPSRESVGGVRYWRGWALHRNRDGRLEAARIQSIEADTETELRRLLAETEEER